MLLAVACALLRANFAGSFARSSALIRQKRKNAAASRSKLLSTSGLSLSQDVTPFAGSPTLLSSSRTPAIVSYDMNLAAAAGGAGRCAAAQAIRRTRGCARARIGEIGRAHV